MQKEIENDNTNGVESDIESVCDILIEQNGILVLDSHVENREMTLGEWGHNIDVQFVDLTKNCALNC